MDSQSQPRRFPFTLEDGTVAELTEEEILKAASFGLNQLNKKQKEKAKPKDDKNLSTEERLEAMERREQEREKQKLIKERDKKTLETISNCIGQEPALKFWKDEVTASIIGRYSLEQFSNPGVKPDIAKIIAGEMKKFKAKLATAIDPNAKENAKEQVGAGTVSGKTSGDQKPASLTRKSFRDGSLTNRIMASMSKLAKESME